MDYYNQCEDIVVSARRVSLKYYLACILRDLYAFHNRNKSSITITSHDIEKFNYVYKHLIMNENNQNALLIDSKSIYCINYLLSIYQQCFTELVQIQDIKYYIKVIMSEYTDYKSNLSVIHDGVKVICKLYNYSNNYGMYNNADFEQIIAIPLNYKGKSSVKLCNILCVFQCMEYKPINLTHTLVKNTLNNNPYLAKTIFEMPIISDKFISDDSKSIITDEEHGDIADIDDIADSLLVNDNKEYYENDYYNYQDFEVIETVNIPDLSDITDEVEEETLEDNIEYVDDYEIAEYSDGE